MLIFFSKGTSMKNFIQVTYKYKPNDKVANLTEVNDLLDAYSKIYEPSRSNLLADVKENFPIVTDENNEVRILGTAPALMLINQIDNHKLDVQLAPTELTNVDFKLVPPSSGYEMYFEINDKKVSTLYNAKDTFLDHYSLSKYANFLLQNDKKRNLLDELKDLQETKELSSKKAIYRFIENDGKQYLRAIVSDRYKFYDNPVALYIAIAAISKYSSTYKKDFILENLILTDSKLFVYFLEKDPVPVDKNITIQTGLVLTNSELGDGCASFKVYYIIRDSNNNRVVGLTDQIANINHGNKPAKIETSFNNLDQLKHQRDDIIQAVKKVAWTKKLTRDDLDTISHLISHIQSPVPKTLKENMAKCVDSNSILEKSYTLLKLFDKFNSFIEAENPNIQLIMEKRLSRWLARFAK